MRHIQFCLLLTILASSSLPAEELIPLAGKPLKGKLLAVTDQNVSFQPADGPVATVSLKDVAVVDFKTAVPALPKDQKYDLVELVDGSLLRVSEFKIAGKQVSLKLLSAATGVPEPKLTLPLNNLFWYLRSADDAAQRQEFDKLLESRGKRDLFVVKTAGGLNPIAGTVLEGTESGDRIQFEREDGLKVALPLSRASGGIIFNQPPRDQIPPTRCKVIDVFGNLLYANQLELQGEGLKLLTVSGATVDYPAITAISKLDFSQGNLLYLSDMSPAIDYKPADKDGPLGDQFYFQPLVQNDRAVFSPEIILDGKKYAKGLSIPRGTIVSYKLDGSYREFKAIAGILDGNNRDDWMLRLTIEVDRRVVFSEQISKKDKAKLLGINVKDSKEFKMIVESVGEYQGDQLNLAEARFQK